MRDWRKAQDKQQRRASQHGAGAPRASHAASFGGAAEAQKKIRAGVLGHGMQMWRDYMLLPKVSDIRAASILLENEKSKRSLASVNSLAALVRSLASA